MHTSFTFGGGVHAFTIHQRADLLPLPRSNRGARSRLIRRHTRLSCAASNRRHALLRPLLPLRRAALLALSCLAPAFCTGCRAVGVTGSPPVSGIPLHGRQRRVERPVEAHQLLHTAAAVRGRAHRVVRRNVLRHSCLPQRRLGSLASLLTRS